MKSVMTFLRVGVSNEIIKRQIIITNQIKKINKELDTLNTAYEELEALYPVEALAEMDMIKKIDSARFTKKENKKALEEELEIVEKKIEESKKAKVEMRGAVYEGVVVEVNGKRWIANERSVGIRVRDDENGVKVDHI